jgi:hypothetical protein
MLSVPLVANRFGTVATADNQVAGLLGHSSPSIVHTYAKAMDEVESLSAVIVARSLGPDKLDLVKWSTLAGCAYVIARGLGSYDEAKKEFIGSKAA